MHGPEPRARGVVRSYVCEAHESSVAQSSNLQVRFHDKMAFNGYRDITVTWTCRAGEPCANVAMSTMSVGCSAADGDHEHNVE